MVLKNQQNMNKGGAVATSDNNFIYLGRERTNLLIEGNLALHVIFLDFFKKMKI